MSTTVTGPAASRKPIRLWPGLIALAALLLARFGVKAVIPGFEGFRLSMLWGFGGVGLVLLWWLFFSRARWVERLGGLALIGIALFGAWQLRHETMGPLWLFAYAVPFACVGLVFGVAAGRRLDDGPRRAAIAAAILLACGMWTIVRMEGISGDHAAEFSWRWTPTVEDRLRTEALPTARPADPVRAAPRDAAPAAPAPAAAAPAAPVAPAADPTPVRAEAAWPGFRGRSRDGIIRGVRINTNWTATPPVELWRRPIGPGWSSFAVDGNRIYTQEQRGDDEIVAAYDAATGAPVWAHRDAARFFESNAGPGPRGTPTLSDGRVYTLGATGIVNSLDARDGSVVWSRNAASELGVSIPYWGISSSPLIVGDAVIVALSGTLAAYDRASGKPRWSGPTRGESYSSPQLMTIDGVTQVVLMTGGGALGVAPADGKVLWEHEWKGFPIVQPALLPEGGLLIAASGTSGIRRIAVARKSDTWSVERQWGTNGLKPYFNDLVVHEGHAYGFDGRILACIDLTDGARKWKGGRFGNGQLILLADQDLLLVLSEEGELALVSATPDQFTELARFEAIEGKTWNHPVLAGDVLFVRNGEAMAAFRLPQTTR